MLQEDVTLELQALRKEVGQLRAVVNEVLEWKASVDRSHAVAAPPAENSSQVLISTASHMAEETRYWEQRARDSEDAFVAAEAEFKTVIQQLTEQTRRGHDPTGTANPV